ncbi:MAG: hypothetical protein CM1200mP30_04410 [Pseudomonadota bacterium]|nr:MAG: hypothetical protein CM1200mP30_04410 [Pseudomonadota bacterium]
MAMIKAPEIIPKINKIVMMGGGYFEGGNITPLLSLTYMLIHMQLTPFYDGVCPIVMMPLDVTHKALMQRKWLEGLRDLGPAVGESCIWNDEFL